MRSQWIYMVGYLIVVVGILAALWKAGVLERIGAVWTLIGVVIAIGIGILAVAKIGSEVKIDRS